MRRWLFSGVALVLLAVAAAVIWPRAAPPGVEPTAGLAAAPPGPEFTEVSVAAPASQGLTLTGRVLDPGGQPVAHAQVFLAATAQASLMSVKCGDCGELLLSCRARETGPRVAELLHQGRGFLSAGARTATDAAGHFSFEHLSGVSFTVWATAPGWGEGVRDRAAPGDPVELYLPGLRSIGGRVTDDQGNAIPGARIHAVSRRIPLEHHAIAGESGVFDLGGLGQGPFYLLAESPGYLPEVKQQVEAGPAPLHLILHRPRTLEVVTRSGGAPVPGQVHVAADHLSRDAKGIGGVSRFEGLYPDQVTLTASYKDLSAAPQVLTLTDPVTRVTLDLEPGGSVVVSVRDDAGKPVPSPEVSLTTLSGEVLAKRKGVAGELVVFGPVGVGAYSLLARSEGFKPGTLPVAVKPGQTQVELILARGTSIIGRVLDEYGRPAGGVSVLISPVGETVEADAQGHFEAQVPSPGLYELHAHHSEWGGGQLKVTAPAVGVELHLEPRGVAEITVQSGGRRVEGADAVLWVDRQASFRSDRPSGADGVVLMRGLPAGTYSLVVGHPEYLTSERQKVTLAEGDTTRITLELKPGAKVSGEVVDTDGAPVTGASVSVPHHAAEPTTTDGRGHFELRALKPGTAYPLDVRHPHYEQTERVSATPGEEPVRVVLKRRQVFRGRVVGEGGAPVRRFHIDDRDVTSADGRFELPLPSEGERVIVAVDAPGFEPQMIDRPAAPDLGDIQLTRAPVFSGAVHDSSGAPVADAVVSCDVCSETVLSAADGRFNLSRPPYAASWTVSARKGIFSGTQRASQGAPVEVIIRAAVHLSGSVYLPDGTPAPGVELEGINMDRSEPVTIVTESDGSYLADVPAGNYRFTVGAERNAPNAPAVLAEVGGEAMHLDFGAAPGTGSITVRVKVEPGFALWVIRGEVPNSAMPAMELLRVPYGQMIYQPRGDAVTVSGLPAGAYTVIWGNFHLNTPGGPLVRRVDVPASGELVLTR